ncbi:hypothetical protein AABD61_05900 [Edwardsiella piscicida]|uniref:hypothetical protein n=1 Tax=Edwardsiella piscicida TaxID=1263550 RepID=UPI00370D2463
MTTITKEQLIMLLQHRISVAAKYPDLEPAQIDAAIFKIALASLEAEPDYIRYDCGCCGWQTIDDWRNNDTCPKCNHKPMGKTELFTTPPAPVSETAASSNSVHDLFLRAKALMYQSGGSPIENSLNPVDAWLFEAERAVMLQPGTLTNEDTNHYEGLLDMVDHSGDTNKKVEPVTELPEPCPRCGCRSSRPNGEHYCHPSRTQRQEVK